MQAYLKGALVEIELRDKKEIVAEVKKLQMIVDKLRIVSPVLKDSLSYNFVHADTRLRALRRLLEIKEE